MLFHAKHTAVLLLGLVLVAVVAVACSEPSTDGNSIRDLEEAIKLNPQDPDNYNKRGMLYHELGQYNRAITDFDEAIRLTNSPEIRAKNNFDDRENMCYGAMLSNNKASVYRALGELVKALQTAEGAVGTGINYKCDNEQRSIFHSNKGSIYNALGNPDSAHIELTDAIILNPRNHAAYNARGIAYQNMEEPWRDYDKAIEDFDKAIELSSQVSNYYYNRGNIHGANGQYEKAIEDLDKAIELNSQDAYAYRARGLVYEKIGDIRAESDLAKAKELGYESE